MAYQRVLKRFQSKDISFVIELVMKQEWLLFEPQWHYRAFQVFHPIRHPL